MDTKCPPPPQLPPHPTQETKKRKMKAGKKQNKMREIKEGMKWGGGGGGKTWNLLNTTCRQINNCSPILISIAYRKWSNSSRQIYSKRTKDSRQLLTSVSRNHQGCFKSRSFALISSYLIKCRWAFRQVVPAVRGLKDKHQQLYTEVIYSSSFTSFQWQFNVTCSCTLQSLTGYGDTKLLIYTTQWTN